MFEALIPVLKQYEGTVPHMYLDTRGYVTCGVGHLLANVKMAYSLPFLLPNGLPAENHDILNDFMAIKQSVPGKLHGYYAGIADLRLAPDSVERLLLSDIQMIADGVRLHLPVLPTLPQSAQDALINMAFQLGAVGLTKGYPRLMAAVRAQNWKVAAMECLIPDAQDARNKANKDFFLSLVS